MRYRRHINKIKSITVLSASLTLIACGGGGSSSSSNVIATQQTEPVQVTAAHWNSADLLSRNVTVINTEFSQENMNWGITIGDDSITQNDHIQVYLDTDNDSTTGFQFDNQAWADKSGADYLIEDKVFFKSTSNNSNWSWKEIANVETIKQAGEVNITVPVSLFEGICNTYNMGVMGRDENWMIEAFAPQSNSMLAQQIEYCDDRVQNQRPVITLSDTTPIVVNQFDEISIPAATALDLEDGDISANITVSDLDSITDEVGVYTITYSVIDSNDLAALPVELTVVVKFAGAESGISVDGNSNDWSTIPALFQNETTVLKVTDDTDHIYILIEGSDLGVNTQIFIDSDNSPDTGFIKSGGTADYMIENNSFSNHLGAASYAWTWNYNTAIIPKVRLDNTIELAIPKSELINLTNTPKFGFTSRDQSWNVKYQLSDALSEYTLQFPVDNSNIQIDAIDDFYEITTGSPSELSVTDNDTFGEDTYFILIGVTQPSAGIVTFDYDTELVTFDPQGNVGTFTYTYTIESDYGMKDTATVTVTITEAVNQSPVAVDDEVSFHVTRYSPTIGKRIHVLDNDTDINGDPLTIISVGLAQNGRTDDAPENTVAYFPNPGFEGTDSFTYTISDRNGGTATAKVTITVTQAVNTPPDAVEDAPTTGMNTPINIKVLENDTDPDGDVLSIVSFTQPPLGAVTQVDAETLRFDPQGNIGSIAFSYTISDSRGGTDSTVVTIATVDPDDTEHASFPVITGENITITEGESILIDVLANDTDADGDVLILDLVDQGGHGTTVKQDGKVLYTPVPDYIGTDEFYYGVHDGYGHNGSGKVTITIIATPAPQ